MGTHEKKKGDTTIKQPILEMKEIWKSFPGVQALKNVNATLHEGEVHALVGENGAGKSTLMNVAFGLIQPDSGSIYRNGQKVVIDSPIVAQKLGIGIVPQELNLVPHLSVVENILLGMEPCKYHSKTFIRWGEMYRKAKEILDRLGENIPLKQVVDSLSVAQQQTVQIARALAFGARILILDEPTASLTLNEIRSLFTIIQYFREEGGAIFYISHRLEEILEITDRISILRDGEKIIELDPKQTTIDEIVKHMVGREAVKIQKPPSFDYSNKKVVLKVENLTHKGELEDISFELYEGEILGLAGLVGAGRTELARCIFGDIKPTSGIITVYSRKVSRFAPWEGIRNNIAYLPEERRKLGIFSFMNIAENMTLPILNRYARMGSLNKKQEVRDVEQMIHDLNIKTPNYKQEIQNLSGGNQQKVILARWLLAGCKILILDEPTRGIDVNAKVEIHNLLRGLIKEGISIVFISSELQEVIDIADRIIVMHEGNKKGEIDGHRATQEDVMKIALNRSTV